MNSVTASIADRNNLDRIEAIDAIRAVALLGVIVMNIGALVMRFVGRDVMAHPTTLDISLVAFDAILVAGKARAAFAFPFGVGFGILLFRVEAKGGDFKGYFTRRMLALLAFGAINQVFLFWGDILMAYALLGLVLLALRDLSPRTLLIAGIALILIPPSLQALAVWLNGGALPGLIALDEKAETARALAALTSANYFDAVAFNATQNLLRHGAQTAHMIVYDLNVLGLFMLGAWSVRSGLVRNFARRRRFLKRVMIVGLLVGLPLAVVNALPFLGVKAEGPLGPVIALSYFGIPILAFAYIAALALAFGRSRAVEILAPAGRMALTNYLASGAIGSWIFYGYGLGMLRKVGIVELNLIGIGIFAGLVLFSHLWLAAFRYGPMEWVWRCLSHGRWQPMLRRGQLAVTV